VAQKVLVSTRTPQPALSRDTHISVGAIKKLVPESQAIHFEDGHVEYGIDRIIFCTGYLFNFPFLRNRDAPMFPAGFRLSNLFEHMIYIPTAGRPNLAFVGLPKMVSTFTMAEAQSAVIARVFATGRGLPRIEMMRQWEANETRRWQNAVAADRESERGFHSLNLERERNYVNRLRRRARTAGLQPENLPPYWGSRMTWNKRMTAQIRTAFKAKGERRHLCTSAESLGFFYPETQQRSGY